MRQFASSVLAKVFFSRERRVTEGISRVGSSLDVPLVWPQSMAPVPRRGRRWRLRDFAGLSRRRACFPVRWRAVDEM